MNLCFLINQFPLEIFSEHIKEIFTKVQKAQKYHVNQWVKILRNLIQFGFRSNVMLLLSEVKNYYLQKKKYAELFLIFNDVIKSYLLE